MIPWELPIVWLAQRVITALQAAEPEIEKFWEDMEVDH